MKKKVKSEAKVMKHIQLQLPFFCKQIIYMDRLNSGQLHMGNTHIRMCKPGTPDLYALMDYNGGQMIFIECKRIGGRQSADQKKFQKMLKPFDNIHYILATSTSDVLKYIKENILTSNP
jgi:hypothetical protein